MTVLQVLNAYDYENDAMFMYDVCMYDYVFRCLLLSLRLTPRNQHFQADSSRRQVYFWALVLRPGCRQASDLLLLIALYFV